jgi:hypothetical protein
MSGIEIEMSPCSPRPWPRKWAGLFEARLDDRLLCTSRQPFLDAARVLVSEGLDPDAVLSVRHAGSGTVALTAKLSVAVRLTVDESKTSFRPWKAFSRAEGSRIIAVDEPEAIPAPEDASTAIPAQRPGVAA